MKVKIGPYKNYFGVYQLAELTRYIGFSEDAQYKLGEYLGETFLDPLFKWIDSKRKRSIYIRIDSYDVWSMDHTLGLIALPMLIKLKDAKHGYPLVDDEDVPEELRSTNAKPKENDWDVDSLAEKRWEWVIDKMIFSFQQIVDDNYNMDRFYIPLTEEEIAERKEKYKDSDDIFSTMELRSKTKLDIPSLMEFEREIDKGFCLFGKYYRSLWD